MTIEFNYRDPDRILLFGREGSGKTKALLDAARAVPGTAYILSTDNSIGRLLDTDFKDLTVREWWVKGKRVSRFENDDDGKVVLYNTRKWEEIRDAWGEIEGRVDDMFGDLWGVDTMTWPWLKVQDWYVEQFYGLDMTDWVNQYRVKLESVKGHSTQESIFNDWQFINANYLGLVSDTLIVPPCHMILTADAEPIRADGKVDKATREYYEQLGMKPVCQKKTGHSMHSVLYMTKDNTGYYINNTVKDRGEVDVEKWPWENFAEDWMLEMGGWSEVDEVDAAPAPKPKKKKVMT